MFGSIEVRGLVLADKPRFWRFEFLNLQKFTQFLIFYQVKNFGSVFSGRFSNFRFVPYLRLVPYIHFQFKYMCAKL